VSTPSFSPDSFRTFGDLLRYLRRRERLTQIELSIMVGYSEEQISRLEKNQRRPDLTALKALFIPALHIEDEPQFINRFLELAQSARQEHGPAPGMAPYKGLLFFDEWDTELFFGRESLTAHLANRVADLSIGSSSRFLAIVGASGSGKSSLIRAGLAVTLQQTGWNVCIFTPGGVPSKALEMQLELDPYRATSERLLTLVDQFEETFTLCRDESERALFIDKLLRLAQEPSGRITIVIALRADFYSHCAQYPLLRQAVAAQQEYIGQMTAEELRRAIEEPAKRGGWEFERGLVDVLLHDIGAEGTSEPEPGALPLLSHALLATWERRRGRILTLDGYHASGGVKGAIAETAESVFTDQLNQTQQELARDVFLRLTELGEGTEDTRRRAALNELVRQSSEATQLRAVLNTLAEARLITLNEDSAEVAHEALIREWQRLHEWLTQDREGLILHRHLTESTHEWEVRGHDPAELYRGARLAQAREWAVIHEERLNVPERAFIAASIEQQEHDALEREAQRQRELEVARKLAESERQRAEVESRRAEEQVHTSRQLRKRAIYLSIVLTLAIIAALAAGFLGYRANINFTRSEAERLAAEANSLLLSKDDSNLIGLLTIRSLTLQYTPPGDDMLSSLTTLQAPPREFRGHTADVFGVDFSPDGKYLASGSSDATARLWDVATGQTIRIFLGHTSEIDTVAFSPDGKYLLTGGGADHTARIWDVATGETVHVYSGHPGSVDAGGFSPDGKLIVTAGGEDLTARIWDVATGKTLHILTGHTDYVPRVAFSPDGKYVLTASVDRTARLWDVETGSQVRVFMVPSDTFDVGCVAFSPDSKYAATGGVDNNFNNIARLWEIATGKLVREFRGHQDFVAGIKFSPDGHFLLTGSADRTARLWDIATGEILRIFSGHTNSVQNVTFSPDGTLIATASNDGIVRVWNLHTFPGGIQFTGHATDVRQASFSPDGKWVVTASADHTARIWNAATGQTVMILKGHTADLNGAVFSPDGKYIVSGSGDKTARLWDVQTGKEVRVFSGHTDAVLKAVFSPDGKFIVTTSNDGTARVWDAQTARTLVIFTGQGPDILFRAAFSPDGKMVATSGKNGTAHIWNPLTGKDIMVFKGHTALVSGVAFSPDGKYLLTSSWDGTAHLWDVATGKEVRRFLGHSGNVFGGAFSPDGKYVLTGGSDRTARLWDVATGKEVRRFTGHTDEVHSVAFSPDGRYILTASRDGTARLWLIDLHDTIREVCALLTRDLTPGERIQFGISEQGPTCPAQ
jgi:WD40 repeat protein/transcriptional regulator with XRE-family HTH domain